MSDQPYPDRPCRCKGTGTITAIIPLADSVLLNDRACPGCVDCIADRQLAEAVEEARRALAASRDYRAPTGVEP